MGLEQILNESYNICNALQVTIFLREKEWQAMNNVMALTYFALLMIHLAHSENENLNIMLRYIAFATITIAQVKDGFWAFISASSKSPAMVSAVLAGW